MATWSATRSTSWTKCDEKNTVRPSALMTWMMLSSTSRRTITSSPEAGSSRINNSGSCPSTSARLSWAFMPRDRCLIFCLGSSPKCSISAATFCWSQRGYNCPANHATSSTFIQSYSTGLSEI